MRAPTQLPAVCAIFDRARERVPRADLPHLVMNDPGCHAYVAAYERVLSGGVSVLLERHGDGLPLIGSFEITENLLLSHNDAGESVSHRWFSVLTACLELLGASDYGFAPFSRTLATLLVDSFALKDAGVPGAPLDLVPLVCREWRACASDPHERTLTLLGELFTASLTDAEIDSICQALSARHDESQQWYAAEGEKNPSYADRPEFIWGAAVRESELPTWLDLATRHFPARSQPARETRERLLRDGEAWLRSSHRENSGR